MTPTHNIVARFIHAYYGDAIRLAWTWHARRYVDLFLVYDRTDGAPSQLSAKVLVAL